MGSVLSWYSNYLISQEEDLVEVENKLERIDDDIQTKTESFEELKREMQKLRQIVNQHQATISSLMADSGPLQVYYNQLLRKWKWKFIYLFLCLIGLV